MNSDILAIPLKKTSEIDLIKPMKNLIALRFSTADNPESFEEAIDELHKLRSNATVRALDKQEQSIEIYARLIFIQFRCSLLPLSLTPSNLVPIRGSPSMSHLAVVQSPHCRSTKLILFYRYNYRQVLRPARCPGRQNTPAGSPNRV